MRDFALEARFALRISRPDKAPESSGGRLDWQHKHGDNRILISNPLGIGLAEIDTSPTRSSLRTSDGQTRESTDPDALMEEVTGQRPRPNSSIRPKHSPTRGACQSAMK